VGATFENGGAVKITNPAPLAIHSTIPSEKASNRTRWWGAGNELALTCFFAFIPLKE